MGCGPPYSTCRHTLPDPRPCAGDCPLSGECNAWSAGRLRADGGGRGAGAGGIGPAIAGAALIIIPAISPRARPLVRTADPTDLGHDGRDLVHQLRAQFQVGGLRRGVGDGIPDARKGLNLQFVGWVSHWSPRMIRSKRILVIAMSRCAVAWVLVDAADLRQCGVTGHPRQPPRLTLAASSRQGSPLNLERPVLTQ